MGKRGSPRRVNRGRLLEVLRRDGPTPRVALARAAGLSFAAISAITAKLIADGLLCEAESDADAAGPADVAHDTATLRAESTGDFRDTARGRGRPAIELMLNPDFGRVVAVSLRMNLIETLIADFSGAALAQSRKALATRALDANALYGCVIEQIATMLGETGTTRERLLGIGMAFQGIVNAERGRQLWSPALSITNVDVAEPLRRAFGVAVGIANDAVAVALAIVGREPALARGLSATIMIGHGVGMGVLMDGEPILHDGDVGSEIGHVKLTPDGPQCRCGQRGCIEAYLADYALYRDARTFLDLPPAEAQQPSELQMELLRERALHGDAQLKQLFRQAGRALADAVATTMSVLRPHHIILAGPGMAAFQMMRPAYEERLSDAVLPWLRKRTAVLVRPCAADLIVGGMVRRTLRAADRRLIEHAPPDVGVDSAGTRRVRSQRATAGR